MKEIIIKIDDEAFRRAEGIADARKISVSALVEELVESATNEPQPSSDGLESLFTALDKGCNTDPIGRFERQTRIPFEEAPGKLGI